MTTRSICDGLSLSKAVLDSLHRSAGASSEVQQRKHDTQVLTSGGAAARQEGAYVGEWQLKAYGGVYLDYTWPLNYFEQQHCLLSQEACTLATTPKKVGIGGCELPAEDDRVLAAFKTDVVSKELDNKAQNRRRKQRGEQINADRVLGTPWHSVFTFPAGL